MQLVGSGTEKWASALLDVQDLADRIGKKHGGYTPLAENYCKANGKFHSIPDFFIDFPGLYRKDLWTEIGMPNGPDTWDDLRTGGAKLKAKGFPVGIGLAAPRRLARLVARHHVVVTGAPRWPRTARPSPTTPRKCGRR